MAELDNHYYTLAVGVANRFNQDTGGNLDPTWILAQWAHESAHFTSELYRDTHNLGGLTTTTPTAYKQPDGGNWYMTFDSDEDFAAYFAHYLEYYVEDGLANANSLEEYIHALKHGGYFGDSEYNYVNGCYGYLNGGSADQLQALGVFNIDSFGHNRVGHVKFEQPEEMELQQHPLRSAWDRFKDSTEDAFLDSGMGSLARYLYSFSATQGDGASPFGKVYHPTDTDKAYVEDLLPDDVEAQNFVLSNAYSVDHLYMLAAMKKEDADRRKRLEEDSKAEGADLAGIAGTITGSLMDPVNIGIMATGAGMGASPLVSRLGAGVVSKLSSFAIPKGAQFAAKALGSAAAIGADRYAANKFGGFTPDYVGNMALGAALGAGFDGLRLAKNIVGTKAIDPLLTRMNRIESNTIANVLDATPPSSLTTAVRQELYKNHRYDVIDKLVPTTNPTLRKQFSPDTGNFLLTEQDAMKFAKEHEINVSSKAKSFRIPGTGQVVYIADRINSEKTLEKAITHNFVVDTGLPKVIGEDKWQHALDKFQGEDVASREQGMIRALKGGANDRTTQRLLKNIKQGLMDTGLVDKPIKDKEARQILLDALHEDIERSKPPKIIQDGKGGAYVNGVYYSKDNIFNPVTQNSWLEDMKDVEKETQGDLPKWLRPLGRKLESSKFFNNYYGILANSKVKGVQIINDLLNDDPRQRGLLYTRNRDTAPLNTVGRIKKHVLRKFSVPMNNILDIRAQWLKNHGYYHAQKQYVQYFNQQVQQCYNYKYGGNKAGIINTNWDPEVQKAAEAIHELRKMEIEVGQLEGRQLGGKATNDKPFIAKDWVAVDEELARHVDHDAVAKIINDRFGGDAKAFIDQLQYVAHQSVKTETLRNQMQRRLDHEWSKLSEEARKGKKPPKVTDEELDAEIDRRCKEWALGVVDQNRSNIAYHSGNSKWGDDPVKFMRSRLPMDTTTPVMLRGKDGPFEFIFDRDIRDTDCISILQDECDRLSGEIAMRANFGGLWREPGSMIDLAYRDIDKAVALGEMTKSEGQRQKDVIEESISRVLGTNVADKRPQSALEAFSRLSRNMAYGNVGQQMTFAQLGEFGGAIGYAGMRTLLKNIPIVRDVRNKLLSSTAKLDESVAEQIRGKIYGVNLGKFNWRRTAGYESKAFRDSMGRASFVAKALDKTNDIATIFSHFTSTINQLPALTDAMIRQGQEAGIVDAMRWARGTKEFSKWGRNPFSKYNLRAVGITSESQVNAIKKDIKYFCDPEKFTERFNTWSRKNPTTYYQFLNLVDNYSNRTIQQMEIGGTNALKEQNWFTKMLFQFKDFSLRAVNSQTMKALSSHQMDDALAAVYSMGTNCLSYMGLTYLRAFAKYPNDEEARNEYLERNLSDWKLGWAAISRGAIIGSIPSFGSDLYEVFTGTPMMRTTVNNTYKRGNGPVSMKAGDIIGRAVDEMPAVSSVLNPMYYAAKGAYRLANGSASREDINSILGTLPMNGWAGLTLMSALAEDAAGVESKYKRKNKAKIPTLKDKQEEESGGTTTTTNNSALDKIMNVI